MATQSVWPVNDAGNIVLKIGSGNKSVSGFVNQDMLPSESDKISVVIESAPPQNISTRVAVAADDGKVFVASSATTLTINTNMPSGYGFSVKGSVTFTAGAGVTLNDVRTAGVANPWCALVQIGVNTYDVVGGKS